MPKKALKAEPQSAYDAQGRPVIQAPSALLIDAATGKVLYSKNPYMELPPASTTKIMTALLTLEHGKLDDVATISKNVSETPYTSIHLMNGEKITVRMLLYGALMRSANDACVALAEHVGGNVAGFVDMMNRKAEDLGAKHTHFVTPNGLHDPNHYTCAADLARFTERAIQYPLFNQIVSTRKIVLQRSINKEDATVFNRNHFLYRYDGADGIKTGYTKQAGHCLVGSATHGGWRLITVILHSPNILDETARLMNYGFSHYERMVLVRQGQKVKQLPIEWGSAPSVPVVVKKNLSLVVAKGHTQDIKREYIITPAHAPIIAGQHLGTVYALKDGRRIASVPLVAGESVGRSPGLLVIAWVASLLLVAALVWRIRRHGRTSTKNHRSRRGHI